MLEKIILHNYTTFINKTEITFAATSSKILNDSNVCKNRILKGALFVGENASGKTNILKAITLLISLLTSDRIIDFARYKSFYTKKSIYTLEYWFNIDQVRVVYALSLDKNGIASETLTKDGTTVIRRDKHEATYISIENTMQRTDLSTRLPFLRQVYYDVNFYNDKTLTKLYSYILNSIYISCRDQEIAVANRNTLDAITYENYFSSNGVAEVNEFFQKIGYQQSIIYTNHTPPSQKTNFIMQMSKPFVAFKKEGTDVYIPEFFESTGNITLIHVLPAILRVIKQPGIVIVDEFSSGLHNSLEEALIRYFFHYSKKSQIFFTTHSTNVLNNTIIRPDQVYSVRFDHNKGQSVISRFSEQNPREAQNPEKMYLNGVFDEVPQYTKHFTD